MSRSLVWFLLCTSTFIRVHQCSNDTLPWVTTAPVFPSDDCCHFSAYSASSSFGDCIFIFGGSACPRCIFCFNTTSNSLLPWNGSLSSPAINYIHATSVLANNSLYFVHNSNLRRYDLISGSDTILLHDFLLSHSCLVRSPASSRYLFVANGAGSGTFAMFDTVTRALIPLPQQPHVRSGPSCVLVDDVDDMNNNASYLFVLSGGSEFIDFIQIDTISHAYEATASNEQNEAIGTSSDVSRASAARVATEAAVNASVWHTLPWTLNTLDLGGMSYDTGRYVAATSYGGFIWLLGGYDSNGYHSDVARVNIKNGDFEYLGPYLRPVARASAQIVQKNEYGPKNGFLNDLEEMKIYVWGGWDGTKSVQSVSYSVANVSTRPTSLSPYETNSKVPSTSASFETGLKASLSAGSTGMHANHSDASDAWEASQKEEEEEETWLKQVVLDPLFLPLMCVFGVLCVLICCGSVLAMFRMYLNHTHGPSTKPKRLQSSDSSTATSHSSQVSHVSQASSQMSQSSHASLAGGVAGMDAIIETNLDATGSNAASGAPEVAAKDEIVIVDAPACAPVKLVASDAVGSVGLIRAKSCVDAAPVPPTRRVANGSQSEGKIQFGSFPNLPDVPRVRSKKKCAPPPARKGPNVGASGAARATRRGRAVPVAPMRVRSARVSRVHARGGEGIVKICGTQSGLPPLPVSPTEGVARRRGETVVSNGSSELMYGWDGCLSVPTGGNRGTRGNRSNSNSYMLGAKRVENSNDEEIGKEDSVGVDAISLGAKSADLEWRMSREDTSVVLNEYDAFLFGK